jgi:hypothetical protein
LNNKTKKINNKLIIPWYLTFLKGRSSLTLAKITCNYLCEKFLLKGCATQGKE